MNTTERTKKIEGKNYIQEGNLKNTKNLSYDTQELSTQNVSDSFYEKPTVMNLERDKLINYTNALNKNSEEIMSFLNLNEIEKRENKNKGKLLL